MAKFHEVHEAFQKHLSSALLLAYSQIILAKDYQARASELENNTDPISVAAREGAKRQMEFCLFEASEILKRIPEATALNAV